MLAVTQKWQPYADIDVDRLCTIYIYIYALVWCNSCP